MKTLRKRPVVDLSKCVGCHSCERKCAGKAMNVLLLDGADTGKKAPCSSACPAGIDVCGYVGLAGLGRFEEAYDLILKNNPFPSVCGRICTRPCESKCNRGRAVDDKPIAIRDIKRFVADNVFKGKGPQKIEPLPAKGKSVGIVGAGPSGMTCAYYLALLGYEVHVYEEESLAGGVLRFGIPEYRLPDEILQREIDHIINTGVHMHYNTSLGKDITIEELKAQHSAIYLSTGAKFSKKMGIPGEDLAGVYHGLDFLRDVNAGKKPELGEKIVVVGGGNTAIDVSRTVLRMGYKDVTILYRRNRRDMPAERLEIVEALEEGVKVLELLSPVEVIGTSHVEGVRCQKMRITQRDAEGRRGIEPISGSEEIIACDTLIPAVSQFFDLPFAEKNAFRTNPKGMFETNEYTLETSVEGIFAGGDMTRGADVAIVAIADGKKSAISIDQFLGGEGILFTGEEIRTPKQQHTDDLYATSRLTDKYLELDERSSSFKEVALTQEEADIVAEARRCLRCESGYKAVCNVDHCVDCGFCSDFCPNDAVTFVERDEPVPKKIEIKPEHHEKILEMCRNAKLYPTALVCVCFYTTVADICEVILEGATTVLEIIRRTGFASGCGKYCPTMAARILRANGYETPEDQYGFHYPQGTMAVRDLPAEIAKDYPYNHVDQEREKYYQEDIMEDVNFWWPKEGK